MSEAKAPAYKAPAGYEAQYRALKILKRHKFPDGYYRDVMPDQDVPGAENWPNVFLWVKRGHIQRKDGAEVKWGEGGEYQPPKPVTEAHIRQQEKEMKDWAENGQPDPPVWGKSQIGPGEKQEPGVRDPDDAEIESALAKRKPTKPVDQRKLAKLQSMSRAKLIAIAHEQGLKINDVEDKGQIAQKLLQPRD